MPYSKDADLVKVQKDILSLSENGAWLDQHKEAEVLINRDLKASWFNAAANVQNSSADFDPDLIEPVEQLKRLSVFKTLELAYLLILQDAEEDPFRKKMELFANKYKEELNFLITEGITYDWDDDGTGDTTESNYLNARLLVR